MAKRLPSVQWRIMRWQLPLLAALFFGVLFWLGRHLEGLLYEADLEVARQSSLLTTSAVKARMQTAGEHEAWDHLLDGIPLDEGTRIEVVNTRGAVLFATDPARRGARYRMEDPPCAVCHEGGSSVAKASTARILGPDETPFQVFGTPLRNTAECRTCHGGSGEKLGMVIVRRSMDGVHRRVRTIQLALALAGAVAFLLTVTTTRILLGRYLGRPIRRLVVGAEAIGTGGIEARIELPERSELSVLADALNNSAAKVGSLVATLSRQRDDFQTLYGLVDQLSRAILPAERRRTSVELAARVLKKDCALLRVGSGPGDPSAAGTLTFRAPDGRIAEEPLDGTAKAANLPAFYDPGIADRWRRGEFAGEMEVRAGATIVYPLRRQGRDLGLLLSPAGDFSSPMTAADPGMVAALSKHLAIGLAYSDLQEELVESERLAAIGETVAGLAHCLKNVLNGLRGGIYVTNRALELKDDKKLESGWRVLRNSVGEVERLTLDMLYYVKDRSPRREPVDPNEVLVEIAELLGESAPAKGVRVRAETDESIGTFPLDRTAIYRAVLNLATNAVDACVDSPNGDLVVLRSELVGDDLVLSVRDNGAGMPPSVQQRLFQRFFSTKQSRGTGLGLPVVRKIAEEHGGSVAFESEIDVGSVFRIRLPRVNPA